MSYNVLRRSVKSGNKSVYRWYYSFIDPATGIKKQRVIPDCKNRAEAYAYISQLPPLHDKSVKLKDIARDMFIPGSMHLVRLEQHGTVLAMETLSRHRKTTELIISLFGEMELKDNTSEIINTEKSTKRTIGRS